MLTDPELGGSKGLPDLLYAVNRMIHYDDPRWLPFLEKIGRSPAVIDAIDFQVALPN